jgi:hypothetical protein
MLTLSAAELLAAWDRGCQERPPYRPLTLLAAACDLPVESLANARIGRTDALLLLLHERTFGPWLDGLTTCPACADELHVEVAVGDLVVPDPVLLPVAERAWITAVESRQVASGGYELEIRAPNGHDAAAAAAAADAAESAAGAGIRRAAARAALLDRCVVARDHEGTLVPATDLPAEVVDTAVVCMAGTDPQADVRLAVTCPTCGTSWEVPVDPGSFLWSEVEAWARRTMLEVHQLAAAYGWSEAEVLTLGPRRRQAYLELIGSCPTT